MISKMFQISGTATVNAEIVRLLLPICDNPNVTDPDGLTPIQAAVYLGHSEVVRILAQYWISDSPNAPNHLGWIPIQTAAKKDMPKLLGFWLFYVKSQMIQIQMELPPLSMQEKMVLKKLKQS